MEMDKKEKEELQNNIINGLLETQIVVHNGDKHEITLSSLFQSLWDKVYILTNDISILTSDVSIIKERIDKGDINIMVVDNLGKEVPIPIKEAINLPKKKWSKFLKLAHEYLPLIKWFTFIVALIYFLGLLIGLLKGMAI